MIRIFITAILYLISLITQAQGNSNQELAFTFEHVTKGAYAITCFYDENDNGKMDFNGNGMPLEDYGSSNNVMNLGPPRFSDAKFEVSDKDLTFEIRF